MAEPTDDVPNPLRGVRMGFAAESFEEAPADTQRPPNIVLNQSSVAGPPPQTQYDTSLPPVGPKRGSADLLTATVSGNEAAASMTPEALPAEQMDPRLTAQGGYCVQDPRAGAASLRTRFPEHECVPVLLQTRLRSPSQASSSIRREKPSSAISPARPRSPLSLPRPRSRYWSKEYGRTSISRL
jgi:hypothetical protein